MAAGRHGELPPLELQQAWIAQADGVSAADDLAVDAWQVLDLRELARLGGPYWIRVDLELGPQSPPDAALSLRLSLRAASEIYWDGRLIGRNGRVGDSAESEIPGRIDWTLPLPAELSQPGRHQLLIHASSFRQGFEPQQAEFRVQIGPADLLYRRAWGRWLIAAIAVGAMAVAGLYFVAMQRDPARPTRSAERLLIALALVGLLLPLTEGWRVVVGYSYDLHPLRLNVLLLLTACAATLLPAYLHARFGSRGRGWPWLVFAALLLLIVFAVPGYDGRSLMLHLLGLLSSLLIMLRARGTDPDDRLPVIALLLATLALPLTGAAAFLDGLYFIALAVLMTFLLLRHAASLAALGQQVAELRAQRSRLRIQLLQRSIHPHWLMNTLTSLQELIEQAPAQASRMVELLADEFARTRAIGERPLIPLAEEIELCRSHLHIVGTAHGRPIPFELELDDKGMVDSIELPPGMLHALVENALTHAGAAACAASGFRLQVSRHGCRVRLQLHAAMGKDNGTRPIERTGSHFIRASLETAYAGDASFEHGGNGQHWHSRIEFPCAC